MNNDKFDNAVIDFHSQLLIKAIVEKTGFNKGHIPDALKIFVEEFTQNIAKIFIEEKINNMQSYDDFKDFPEQYINYADVQNVSKKFLQKDIDSFLKQLNKASENIKKLGNSTSLVVLEKFRQEFDEIFKNIMKQLSSIVGSKNKNKDVLALYYLDGFKSFDARIKENTILNKLFTTTYGSFQDALDQGLNSITNEKSDFLYSPEKRMLLIAFSTPKSTIKEDNIKKQP